MTRQFAFAAGLAALLGACSPANPASQSAQAPGMADPSPAAAPAAVAPDLASNAASGAAGAEQLVRTLNARSTIPETKAEFAKFFATDIAAAFKPEVDLGEVGSIDYDYRWNAQDFEIADVTYATASDGRGRATVTVSYKNFGEAGTTIYDLCRRESGQWRILDVRSGAEPDASLRSVLEAGPIRETNGC